MPDPRSLCIDDFNYSLPDHRIARFPLEERDRSKCLIYRAGQEIVQDHFINISQYLPAGSLLVLNNTRVIPARLLFTKESGAKIEIFCLEPLEPVAEIHSAFQQVSPVVWKCLIGNARRWKKGRLELRHPSNLDLRLFAECFPSPSSGEGPGVGLSWLPPTLPFSSIISLFGHVPIPPYLKREDVPLDKERYQTIYALPEGSVAAPTAGLHFTQKVFRSLKEKNIDVDYLTLHVGAGTFQPVIAGSLAGHRMHSEHLNISFNLLRKIRSHSPQPLIAVGTTTVRTLESLYWLGVQLMEGQGLMDSFEVEQWKAYDKDVHSLPPAEEALDAIIERMEQKGITTLHGFTRLLIAPGYTYRLLKGMITNFHQPKSTLLLLIAAFLGDRWREIYTYALDNEFRFLSYGDSCLFFS